MNTTAHRTLTHATAVAALVAAVLMLNAKPVLAAPAASKATNAAKAAPTIVELPRVVITGRRMQVVELPRVEIVARRAEATAATRVVQAKTASKV